MVARRRSAAACLWAASAALAQTETISVDVKLRTGGALSGLVVDHTGHGLVIVHDKTPYVFAWSELEGGSAWAAKRALLVLERGGAAELTAEDHFQLGAFALEQGRNDLAVNEFREAEAGDVSYRPLIRAAFDEFRRRREASRAAGDSFDPPITTEANGGPFRPESPGEVDDDPSAGERAADQHDDWPDEGTSPGSPSALASLPVMEGVPLSNRPSPEVRAKVSGAYRTFGDRVREVMGKDIVLLESDHFLIWTDWPVRERDRLSGWCESMYAALGEQFDLDPAEDVFLAKCPVFCFRTLGRFRRFAREFDGYSGKNAIGYTRSIEQSGHVHMAFVLPGRSDADLDRFACTLVHEGTHAFLHRLYSSTLIPHWINEGYADLVAERVLGDRCPAGENAALLARQYARYEWSIGDLLESTAPLGIHQYPLAHSVVAYLEGLGRSQFTGFVKGLKNGRTVSAALAGSYDGLTIARLEAGWRSAVRAADSVKRADQRDGDERRFGEGP